MKIGLFGIGSGPTATAESAARVGIRADELGFDSVWTGEQSFCRTLASHPSPAPPDHDIACIRRPVLSFLAGV